MKTKFKVSITRQSASINIKLKIKKNTKSRIQSSIKKVFRNPVSLSVLQRKKTTKFI